MEDIKSVYPN
ncbi:unnamed protein product, partial [Didymodactylos carnosus]